MMHHVINEAGDSVAIFMFWADADETRRNRRFWARHTKSRRGTGAMSELTDGRDEITTRLAKLAPLAHGAHPPDSVACVMEAVAYVAGEEWSDHPECACPVLTAFLVNWNDALPDDERDALLRPLVPLLVGTRASKTVEARRSLLAADWLIRVHTPAWLRLAKLDVHADALAGLPEITSMAQIPSIRGPIEAARRDAYAARAAAWAAARAAAGDAARAAAGDAAVAAAVAAARAAAGAAGAAARAAAGDAAGDAARDAAGAAARAAAGAAAVAAARAAAGAAGAAAGDAARAAARAAAVAAAGDAAGAALSKTRKQLQQSALDLVKRMIAVREESR